MTRLVYVNGELLPEDQAKVSVFDRAFLMADAVCEVTSVLGGAVGRFRGAFGTVGVVLIGTPNARSA
jgi:D-alanine transaminase